MRCLVLCALLLAAPADAQFRGPPPVTDGAIVAQSRLVAGGERVEIYAHDVSVDPKLLERMEEAYRQVERLTGLRYDTATLGPRVRVYVSNSTPVSHVWRGYAHPTDPRGIIFLSNRVVPGALNGRNATYIHEMTHLFTWRYRSHTLREGIADHVALALLPGAAIGPVPAGRTDTNVAPEVLEFLGTTRDAPPWLAGDLRRRADYYFASRRLVSALVGMKGMGTFLELYASEDPERAIQDLYGMSREDAIRMALQQGDSR